MSGDGPGVSVLTRAGASTPPHRGSAGEAALKVLGVVVTGVVCGVLWWWFAPLARAVVDSGAVYLHGHTELQAAQDCWFAVVLGALGVLTATVQGWRSGAHRSRAGQAARRGVGGQAGQPFLLVVALLLVGLVAWRVGVLLGPDDLAAQVADGSKHPLTPLRLHSAAVLLVGPFLYAFTAFLAAVFSGSPNRA